ncbi:MAG: NADH-quinone oxidoreductase subunit J [Verrucomicrobia bacterium]|nr:NADH-quinone oxidoreductase subunit J [Verrucomicrobiota bacterium]
MSFTKLSRSSPSRHLPLLLLAIAGIYGSLQLQAALLSQLVLYIGGIMVLIGFALMTLRALQSALRDWKRGAGVLEQPELADADGAH